MSAWQPIESAPKDGRTVELTWMDSGEPQEIWRMEWDANETNPFVQTHKGIWVIRDKDGEVLCTWSEKNPNGSPTHWRPA